MDPSENTVYYNTDDALASINNRVLRALKRDFHMGG